ncbi:hypothetical protein FB567DRAFT_504217 [Paraphoma chrysanthemicola]|uniref:Uncharacterized protein n=1 Tax=Paraphoma chrysanthemicola TaxID=798071 RepID=A0A8K0QWB1_9PLEO|nr:hypothetical protein FB567DRAFT_504217 [Paraphoma chrysanthemicola]
MARYVVTLCNVISLLAISAYAQCPNLVAQYQSPNSRTMTSNSTWFILPIRKSDVQKAIDETIDPLSKLFRQLRLLDVPKEYKMISDFHPVIVTAGYMADIRQTVLQLDRPLTGSAVMVPFVGIPRSDTPFIRPITSYLAGSGADGDRFWAYLAAIVPAKVATFLGGIPTRVGAFIPENAAYKYDATGPDGPIYSKNSKWAVFPNLLSGPGIYEEAVDMHFSPEPTEKYPIGLLKKAINQPYLLNFPLSFRCQRNTYFLNNATAEIQFRSGNVTLGPAASANILAKTLMKASQDGVGNYFGVHGFSVCAQLVGYDTVGGQECEQAARDVDPTAL